LTKNINEKQDDSNNDENPSTNNPIWKKTGFLSWAVFLFTLSIVLISLFSVVFPAFIASNNSTIGELKELGIEVFEVNSFELGIWAAPLIAANLIVFGLAILYFKKKLPNSISKTIDFVFGFKLSKKVTLEKTLQ